ncbi:MAG TPA: tetratricopeptide repeat protein [Pyrinomonadaceae bacterium]|nr:tetratricopeptide repeat protein [Pyrinomonadaceae bacterium]
MRPQPPAPRRLLPALAALLLLFCLAAADARPALAQAGGASTAQPQDPEREEAFRLLSEGQFAQALPLLEKLALKYPNDPAVHERLGVAVYVRAETLKDVAERKRERVRSRAAMLRAKELGGQSDIIEMVLAEIPPDGGAKVKQFSANAEADRAMHEGETAFAGGKGEEALAAYERALALDARLYEAPLFAGDVFLQKQQYDKAGEWYARAIALDPDRETAYRYWGNAYLRQNKLEEARQKYVEAIIASPYDGYVWRNGLVNWANRAGVRLSHPNIEPRTTVSPMKDNKMTITIDPKTLGKDTDDGTAAWMMYGLSRAVWTTDDYKKFKSAYPAEKEYRHSLREEADAMRMVVESVKKQQQEGKVKTLDPQLAALVRLHDEGLLEAFILLARPNEGIAQDYADYRKANRDKLRRYLMEYVTAGK